LNDKNDRRLAHSDRVLPRWLRRGTILVAIFLGTIAAAISFRPGLVLAPPAPCEWLATVQPPIASLDTVRSLSQIYQIRDRLSTHRDRCTRYIDLAVRKPKTFDTEVLYLKHETFSRQLERVETRLKIEDLARTKWQAAETTAAEAANSPTDSIEQMRKTRSLWQTSLDRLHEIPENSLLFPAAVEREKDYRHRLATVSERLELAQLATGFILYGDTNRDGVANEADYTGRQLWSWQSGALVLFNNDDDNSDRVPDWNDEIINGSNDVNDLAIVRLRLPEGLRSSAISVSIDDKTRDRVNIFQKTESGWQAIATSAKNQKEMVFGIEAKQFADKNWDGIVTLEVSAKKEGKFVTSDRVQLRVSPWLMLPNTAPVTTFYVSDRGGNRTFIDGLREIIPQTKAELKVIPNGTIWMQDTLEIGTVQFPDRNGDRQVPTVLNGIRSSVADGYAKSLLNANFGWFEIGQPRYLNFRDRWSDWYGNLEVTPPLPDYPFGRVYYGNSGTATLHPDVVEFVKAQELQGPPVAIDTSWLLIRHVDEIISFIPAKDGGSLMLVSSPAAGVELLRKLAENGYGDRTINRGLSSQTTVRQALNTTSFIQHNLDLQRQHLDPIVSQLKAEFSLTDDRIIPLPTLYGNSGYPWWPSPVNSVVVNGYLLVSDPQGAIVDGKDYTQETVKALVERSPLQIRFLDDKFYHEMWGNTHCATNAARYSISDFRF